ncbi:MAG TPA: cyclic-di-AMP receptor [Candidatus Onthomonas avicola]|nr:cyclic-di-AMP receptor [Candidatus Onthomonas avicola]
MKMIVAIVQKDDAAHASQYLVEKGYGATCINSWGTFLQQENRTLLIGVSDDKVREVISLLRSAVHWREVDAAGKTPRNSMLVDEGQAVTVSGATIFVLNVDQFLRL